MSQMWKICIECRSYLLEQSVKSYEKTWIKICNRNRCIFTARPSNAKKIEMDVSNEEFSHQK